MSTYQTKINGKQVTFLKLKKAECETVVRAIRAAGNVQSSWIELTGVIGGEEHKSHLSMMFGPGEGKLANPDKYAADLAALYAEIPEEITRETAARLVDHANAIHKEHLPIVDKRETPAQHHETVTARNAMIKEQEDKRRAERDQFAAMYADSPEPIETPAGMVAIVVQQHFNDSDMMSDYFCGHMSHGEQLVLAYVPKGTKRTERVHRAALEKYPDLAALSWKWDVEDYSNGHGNWLESPAMGTLDGKVTYGGHNDPAWWWEVSFGYGDKHLPYKGFAAAHSAQPRTETAPADETTTPGAFEITHDRNWTWIHFPAKPADSILETLRNAGARWSMRRKAWYLTRPATAADLGLA